MNRGAKVGAGVLAAMVLATASGRGAAQNQLPFRSSTSGVAVHVSVRDHGAPVRGLRLEDFLLTDSGVKQNIQTVSADTVPLDVTLVVDQHEISEGIERGYRTEVSDVVSLLAPADRLRVIYSAGDIWELTPLGPSRPIGGMKPPVRSSSPSTLDALAAALMQPPDAGRQQVVFAMTHGVDVFSVTTTDALARIAERSPAQVHVLMKEGGYMFGAKTLAQRTARATTDARAALLQMAKATGGGRLWDAIFTRSIAEPVSRVFAEVRSGYILYFTPAGVPESGWHPINVSVRRPGKFEIKSRAGYAY